MFGLHRILICGTIILTPVFASDAEGLSLFEKFIGVLVSSALLFSVIKGYLTVNKIWSRRKNEEVANSISIVAAMLGFAVGFPFLLNNFAIHFVIFFHSFKSAKGMQCIPSFSWWARSSLPIPHLCKATSNFSFGGLFTDIYKKRTVKLSYVLHLFSHHCYAFSSSVKCILTKYSASKTIRGFLPFLFITTSGS